MAYLWNVYTLKDNTTTSQLAGNHERILYDADAMPVVEATYFELEYWHANDKVLQIASGRGSAAVIELDSGPALLKRYYRGGLVAKVNKSVYVFNGYERSRAFREYRLLGIMLKLGLPVPEPLAAYCEVTAGVFSRQALITRMLPATETLAQRQRAGTLSENDWQAVGKVLHEFHQQGIYHADLNATNILLNAQGQVFLVDFDKSRQQKPQKSWQEANLQRLKRSLKKLSGQNDFPANGWEKLLDSYKDGN